MRLGKAPEMPVYITTDKLVVVSRRFTTEVDAGEVTPYTLAPYLAMYVFGLAASIDYPF